MKRIHPSFNIALLAGAFLLHSSFLLSVQGAEQSGPLTIDPTFSPQAYRKASNTGADDSFGFSVTVSGDTVVVGEPDDDSNATGINGNGGNNSATNSGAGATRRSRERRVCCNAEWAFFVGTTER